MTEAVPHPTPAHTPAAPGLATLQDRRAVLFIVMAALLVQVIGHMNGDNSWFITFAEHVLAGATPYVDIGDPNLPFGFLIYVPAVLLGRLLGVAPEAALVPLVFVGVGLSLLVAARILRLGGALAARDRVPLLCAATFALLLMPCFCFAEREHVVVILLLPFFAVLAVRAGGGEVAMAAALVAGAGGGLALGIKPHYALALGLPWLWVLRQRGIEYLAKPEMAALVVVAILDVAIVLIFFPAYVTSELPLVLAVYGPARESLAKLLISPLFLANAIVLTGVLLTVRRARDDRVIVAALASLGFLLTFLIQGKGWINHAYPGLALILLALAPILLHEPLPRRFALYVALPFIAVAPFLCGLLEDVWSGEEYPGLTAAVLRVAPPHPTIMGLAQELDVVHPLVRHVDGRFAGRQNCLWVTAAVNYLLQRGGLDPARRERLLRLRAADETMFAEDVRRNRPDVILSESPAFVAWARAQPALAHVLDGYRSVETVGDIEIWLRQQG